MNPLRVLTARSTYTGWLWLILGGAIVMPYLMAGEVVEVMITGEPAFGGLLFGEIPLFGVMLPVVALTGLLLPVRAISVSLARVLLRVDVPSAEGSWRDWSRRWRDAAWFTIHLGVGGLIAGVTLALVPFAFLITTAPLWTMNDLIGRSLHIPGWQPWWGAIAGPVSLLLLVYLVAAVTAGLRWAAPKLLGPTPPEQLAATRSRARQLAARNRIARELHDSVGHALSVVTVQAEAARKLLDTDPAFVSRSLETVAETARSALVDLDTVLGVLREDGPADTAPAHTLEALPALLDGCGVPVTSRVVGEVESLPPIVSREAYRIVQESLTNALRYADGAADVEVTVEPDRVRIEVANRIRPQASRPRGGRGISGMTERAAVLGGELTAGPDDGQWRVRAELPVGS